MDSVCDLAICLQFQSMAKRIRLLTLEMKCNMKGTHITVEYRWSPNSKWEKDLDTIYGEGLEYRITVQSIKQKDEKLCQSG